MAAQTTHVKLQQHQPGSDPGHDLLAVQGHVQRALDQLQAQKVQQASIEAGAVGASQLATLLRQCFKYKLTSNASIASSVDLNFGTKISDDLGMVSGGIITPKATGLVRLHVQLHLGPRGLSASFNSAFRAQAFVVDSTGETVHASRWAMASTNASGGYEIVVDLDTELRLTIGRTYTVRTYVLDGSNNPFSTLTLAAESLSGSPPYTTGSHFELMPTPGS